MAWSLAGVISRMLVRGLGCVSTFYDIATAAIFNTSDSNKQSRSDRNDFGDGCRDEKVDADTCFFESYPSILFSDSCLQLKKQRFRGSLISGPKT